MTAPTRRPSFATDRDVPHQCPTCPASIAEVQSSRAPVTCACGAEYVPAPHPRRRKTAPCAPAVDPVAALPTLLHALALAARWRAVAGHPAHGGPAPLRNPLVSWQATATGRTDPASEDRADTVRTQRLWQLLTDPRAGERAREGFTETLLRYCEDTSRPEEPDWTEARACAARLDQLAAGDPDVGRALRALRDRVSERATWPECAAVVAEALAPAALVTAWLHPRLVMGDGARGRPRVDRTAPSGETERVAWGEAMLTKVVLEWVRR